jgi:hypothetical protein
MSIRDLVFLQGFNGTDREDRSDRGGGNRNKQTQCEFKSRRRRSDAAGVDAKTLRIGDSVMAKCHGSVQSFLGVIHAIPQPAILFDIVFDDGTTDHSVAAKSIKSIIARASPVGPASSSQNRASQGKYEKKRSGSQKCRPKNMAHQTCPTASLRASSRKFEPAVRPRKGSHDLKSKASHDSIIPICFVCNTPRPLYFSSNLQDPDLVEIAPPVPVCNADCESKYFEEKG